MTKPWEFMAQCLRAELADYGGLLHLLEAQERCRFHLDAEAVLRFAAEIELQVRALVDSRCRREQAVATFAKQNSRPMTSSLRAMLPLIESDARPLLKVLISEINLLLRRVRRASGHNHSLLSPPNRDAAKNAAIASATRDNEGLSASGSPHRPGRASARRSAGHR